MYKFTDETRDYIRAPDGRIIPVDLENTDFARLFVPDFDPEYTGERLALDDVLPFDA